MVTQEILDTFVFSTIGGEKFGVNDPITHDEIIGYYPTRGEAEKAFIEYVEKEGIIFKMENMRNEKYYTDNPALFLIRGCPGSGKSTFAKHIWNEHAICEADKFFYNKETGEYNFEASKLKEAHEWCRNEVEIRMKDHQVNPQYYPEIVVSNTFTQEWEMQAYIDLAKKYGYQVTSLIIENRHGNPNIHNVPMETLERMRQRFDIKL